MLRHTSCRLALGPAPQEEKRAASVQSVAKNADALSANVQETSSSVTRMMTSVENVAKKQVRGYHAGSERSGKPGHDRAGGGRQADTPVRGRLGLQLFVDRKGRMELPAEDISIFKDLVYQRCHLSFPQSRETQLRRWLLYRLEEGKYGSLDEYYRALSSNDGEFERLISLITTRETYFFRMPEQFEAVRDVVLPKIIDREGKKAVRSLSRGEVYRMMLRAWSAGCASGQETYSLSMQILDTVRYSKAWDLRVLGTDINADALEFAKTGRYDRMRLGKTPASFMEKYFNTYSPAEIVVCEEVREITEFQTVNLRNLPEMGSFKNYFDIIFCRNVMIYFDLRAQQRLITELSECLKPGGYLFTGEGEVLHLYAHALEVIQREECVFYRKPEGV